MIDRVLDTWPVRCLVLLVCWLEDWAACPKCHPRTARTYGYVTGRNR